MPRIAASSLLALAAAVATVMMVPPRASPAPRKRQPYRSPYDVAFSPDGRLLAASDHTAGEVVLISAASGKVARRVGLNGRPAGLAWSGDGKALFVAEEGAGTVAEVIAASGKVARRFQVGRYPTALAVAGGKKLLLVTNSGLGSLSVVDLAEGKERTRIGMLHQPRSVAVAPDGSLAVVGNLLPVGDSRHFKHSAAVSLVDLGKLERRVDIRLPGGSTLLRDVAISGDGRWAYAVHTVGRFTLPTTQLERGWVNTNAMSIIDLGGAPEAKKDKEPPKAKAAPAPKKPAPKNPPPTKPRPPEPAPPTKPSLYATVLLDHISEGAADPWGLAVAGDGEALWVTLSGVHQLARIDLEKLHPLLAGEVSEPVGKTLAELEKYRRSGVQVTWLEIKADAGKRKLLVNDLTALHVAGVLKRTPLPGKGPRGVAVAPDGKTVAVGAYYSGGVLLADPGTGRVTRTIPLGPQPEIDRLRRGEMIFHDATYCFQHWLSCATCHPHGRSDGLNWDLLNDGMGNPKNSKSLVLSHKTPPVMARGVRADMETAAKAGFRFILFRVPEASEDVAVQAYLRSLEPEPSPYLLNGKLSKKAQRGKKLYHSRKTNCASCHPPPLYTDLKTYKVGTRHELDRTDEFDTPTLIEMWRTAPFLHDGSAATIKDVLTTHNKKDKHGVTSKLSEKEIEDLAEYLLSL